MGFAEWSNYGCLPGRAEGSPGLTSRRISFCAYSTIIEGVMWRATHVTMWEQRCEFMDCADSYECRINKAHQQTYSGVQHD